MSRLARKPLIVPTDVEFNVVGREVNIKGKKGAFVFQLHKAVKLEVNGKEISVQADKKPHPMVGTTSKLLGNMIHGVKEGFEKKLQLVGVGYRAKTQGKILELSLGYSNPVIFPIPEGISIDIPSNTEIVVKGIDKQIVGEVAAKIRRKRPPEPYKGKGVRYLGENVKKKDVKKK